MGQGKDLNDEEIRLIIKELAKSAPLQNTAKKINRHLMREKQFLHDATRRRVLIVAYLSQWVGKCMTSK